MLSVCSHSVDCDVLFTISFSIVEGALAVDMGLLAALLHHKKLRRTVENPLETGVMGQTETTCGKSDKGTTWCFPLDILHALR